MGDGARKRLPSNITPAEESLEVDFLQSPVQEILKTFTVHGRFAGHSGVKAFIDTLVKMPSPKPVEVKPIGSTGHGCCLSGVSAVDFCLVMPEEFCCGQPTLRPKYLQLRESFLEHTRTFVTAQKSVSQVTVESFASDGSKKFLSVSLHNAPCKVHLHVAPGCPDDFSEVGFLEANRRGEDLYLYHLQAEDMLLCWEFPQMPKNCAEGCILIKLWVQQRGFAQQIGSLNSFLVTVLVAYLVRTGVLNELMGPVQVFRETLAFLHGHDFLAQPLGFPGRNGSNPHPSVLKTYHSRYPAVLLDPTHGLNYLFRWCACSLAEIKAEAKVTMDVLAAMLTSQSVEQVAPLIRQVWLQPTDFWGKWDLILTVNQPSDMILLQGARALSQAQGPGLMHAVAKRIQELLLRAWGDRVTALAARWIVGHEVLAVGVRLGADHLAYSALTKGPTIELAKEGEAFRQFWGTKAEMRRFKDGSITHCCLWDEDPLRLSILRDIARHVLAQHMGILEENVQQGSLYLNHLVTTTDPDSGNRKDVIGELAPGIQAAFDRLSRALFHLDQTCFPLAVTSVLMADSSALTSTAVSRHPHHCLMDSSKIQASDLRSKAQCIYPIHVILQFESSSAWPVHLEAIRFLKQKLYVRLSRRLLDEAEILCVPHREFVDAAVDGYLFRVRIRHHGEHRLLRQLGYTAKLRQLQLVDKVRPLHHDLVRRAIAEFKSYAYAVRLAKLWFSSHMLTPHWSDECIELVVMHVFLYPTPSVPNSHYTAFLRFLRLLRTFDFEEQQMVVAFPDEQPTLVVAPLKSFKAAAAGVSEPAVWLATSYAPDWSPMTLYGPDLQALRRAKGFAEKCDQLLVEALQNPFAQLDTFKGLFLTSVVPFHVLINLRPETHPLNTLSQDFLVPCEKLGARRLHIMVGRDAFQYFLDQLKERFAQHCDFYFDRISGLTVGVVAKSEEARQNLPVLASKFQEMGNGLVASIVVQVLPKDFSAPVSRSEGPTPTPTLSPRTKRKRHPRCGLKPKKAKRT